MLAVAAEELVCAHAGQQHLHAGGPGALAHQQGVDGGGISDRLVEDVDDPGKQGDDVGADLDLVQADAQVLRHQPGVPGVVGHRLQALVLAAERDRVGLDVRVVVVRDRRHQARVEAATEERRHRHVGDQVRGHGALDDVPQVGLGRATRGAGRHLDRVPVGAADAGAVGTVGGPRPRRVLDDLAHRADLLRQPVVEGGGREPQRVDRELGAEGGDDRLELGCEHHAVASGHDVERLDPQRVTGERRARRSPCRGRRTRTCRGTAGGSQVPTRARPPARPRCRTGWRR